MSLAIRKRSWEEHVTQWMGLQFGSIDSNILCRHGLVADNLQAGMENDGLRSESQKEKSASLPDCCHGGELGGLSAKLLGNVSREVDENDNHQEEEEFTPLEASTETLVNVSIEGDNDAEDNDIELSLERVNHQLGSTEEKWSVERNHSEGGAGLFIKMDPDVEAKEDSICASNPVGKLTHETDPKAAKEDIWDSGEERPELCFNSSGENEDTPEENFSEPPDVEKTMPKKKMVHAVVAAQQHEKMSGPKGGNEETVCGQLFDEFSPGQCSDLNAFVADSSKSVVPSPGSCFLSEENVLDENGFACAQDKCIKSTSLVEGISHLKKNTTRQEPADSQVILRKRKEVREDHSRLDSMVLLILKLDQLDQDIENALGSASSPSSTLTHTRRHIPDLELHPDTRVDIAILSHQQANVPPSPPPPLLAPYVADRAFSTPMTGSGAKPKAGAMPIFTEKEKADWGNLNLAVGCHLDEKDIMLTH